MYYLKKIIQLMNKLILQDKNLFYLFQKKNKITINLEISKKTTSTKIETLNREYACLMYRFRREGS